MRISWNPIQLCFELTFGDFKTDLELAKAAGFQTSGPPQWIWYTTKSKVLKKLKELRPEGIVIAQDALEMFKAVCVEEDKRAETKRIVADLKAKAAGKPTQAEKEAKRKEREAVRVAKGLGPIERKPRQARGGMRAEAINEIKYEVPYIAFVPPAAPHTRCIFCSEPVYYYEKTDPLPICLWCEKTIADHQKGDEELGII